MTRVAWALAYVCSESVLFYQGIDNITHWPLRRAAPRRGTNAQALELATTNMNANQLQDRCKVIPLDFRTVPEPGLVGLPSSLNRTCSVMRCPQAPSRTY